MRHVRGAVEDYIIFILTESWWAGALYVGDISQSASILVYHHWDCFGVWNILGSYVRPPHVQYKYLITDLSDPLHVRPNRACTTRLSRGVYTFHSMPIITCMHIFSFIACGATLGSRGGVAAQAVRKSETSAAISSRAAS